MDDIKLIPDFVLNLQEVQRSIGEQAGVTAALWQDCVKERYYEKYVERFDHYINIVCNGIDGTETIYQRSLNDMLEVLSDCIMEMADIMHTSPEYLYQEAYYGRVLDPDEADQMKDNYDQTFNPMHDRHVEDRGGIVHDDRLTRDYWDTTIHGARPGEIGNEDVNRILEERGLRN